MDLDWETEEAHPDCAVKMEAVLWTWTGRRKKHRRAKKVATRADARACVGSKIAQARMELSGEGTGEGDGCDAVLCAVSPRQPMVHCEASGMKTELRKDCSGGHDQDGERVGLTFVDADKLKEVVVAVAVVTLVMMKDQGL